LAHDRPLELPSRHIMVRSSRYRAWRLEPRRSRHPLSSCSVSRWGPGPARLCPRRAANFVFAHARDRNEGRTFHSGTRSLSRERPHLVRFVAQVASRFAWCDLARGQALRSFGCSRRGLIRLHDHFSDVARGHFAIVAGSCLCQESCGRNTSAAYLFGAVRNKPDGNTSERPRFAYQSLPLSLGRGFTDPATCQLSRSRTLRPDNGPSQVEPGRVSMITNDTAFALACFLNSPPYLRPTDFESPRSYRAAPFWLARVLFGLQIASIDDWKNRWKGAFRAPGLAGALSMSDVHEWGQLCPASVTHHEQSS